MKNNKKSNYKLIASDLDWTLVYDKNKINKESLKALHQYLDNGYVFVLITGRPHFSAYPLMERLGLTKYPNFYLSCYNGGSFYEKDKQIIYNSSTISIDEAKEIAKLSQKHKVNFLMYHDEKVFIEKVYDFKDRINTLDFLPLNIIDNYSSLLKSSLIKGILASDEERLKEVKHEFEANFENLEFFFSQPFYLEVMPKNLNKGVALKNIASYLSIPLSDCIALGDGENDTYMFSLVNKSYAMENAYEEVKLKATDVALDVRDASLKAIIEEHFSLE